MTPPTQDGNGSRVVLVPLMEHLLIFMYLPKIEHVIEHGRVVFLPMCSGYATHKCDSFMFFRGGKGLLPIVEYFAMLYPGLMVLKFLKGSNTCVTMVILTTKDFLFFTVVVGII